MNQRVRVMARLADGNWHSSNELRDELGITIRNVPQRISEENLSVTLIPEDYPVKQKLLPSDPQKPKSAIVAWYRDSRIDIKPVQQQLKVG